LEKRLVTLPLLLLLPLLLSAAAAWLMTGTESMTGACACENGLVFKRL
jgi:hypothetical protein